MAENRVFSFFAGTLRRRLVTSVALVHAVLMALFIADTSHRQTDLLIERQTSHAVALANSLAISSAGWLASLDVSGMQELVEAQRRYPDFKYSMLINAKGEVLAHTDAPYRGKVVLDLPKDPTRPVVNVTPELVDVTVAVTLADKQVGWARVGIGQAADNEKIAEIARSGFLYAGAAIVVGSVLAWFLGTLFARRLGVIQDAMQKARAGVLKERVSLSGGDEAAELAEGFNRMLAALEEKNRELKESELKWQFAIEGAGDGLWDWNVQSGECRYSDQWKALLGMSGGEIGETIGEWKDRVHPDDLKACLEEMRSYLAGEAELFRNEHRLRRKDGGYVWTLAKGRAIERSEAGLPVRVIGTHSDITSRKSAEEEKVRLEGQLYQAQKMEAVGRLAGGVAHDFNNMLGVIMGHAELALERVDPANRARNDLIEIQRAAKRSADLTRQLLAFARKQTIAPRVLNLNEAVEGLLKMLNRLIGEDIDLFWRPGKSTPFVEMDPSQLDQILANLCLNARDAIAGVGKITIETGSIAFDEDYCANHRDCQPGDYSLLAVSDDGSGMDKETLQKLFEPFFTTKPMGKGTGLGLATVYGIVRQNHGFLNVYSEPGQGTTFKIYFPARAAVAHSVETAPLAPPKRGTETVLLVEDEPTLLAMSAQMLENLGYKVLGVKSPGDAVALMSQRGSEVRLLLTDVIMPEMNGKDLAEKLRAQNPALKCLYMSGYTANVIEHHGVIGQGVNFLQKPYSLSQLAEKVRSAIDG